MNEYKRGIGRKALYTSLVGAMVLSIMPAAFAAPSAAAAQTCRNINKIDVCGRFLEQWNKSGTAANAVDKAVSPEQGSTYVNGLPITAMKKEISLTDGKTYDTQWFERARYEAHPENKAPYDVLLGLLGVTITEGRGTVDPGTGQVRNQADAAFVKVAKPSDVSATKVWFQETSHTVSGKILEYWNKFGGLQQFGFPLSEQFREVSTDGKTYDVQYFERNKFEIHPEKAAPYEVELGLLGVQQYKTQAIAAADLPYAPPSGVTSTKDTFVQGSQQEPTDLVEFETNTVVAQRVAYYVTMLNAMASFDDKENPIPYLAWYVPTLENGGSYYVGVGNDRHLVTKYKLRRGVKWSDGKEVTSADAIFAYKYILSDPNSISIQQLKKLSGVESPDKYTVIYNWMSLNQATAKFNDPKTDKEDYAFLKLYIDQKVPLVDKAYFIVGSTLPEQQLGKIPADKVVESEYARNPIGWGPYKVQKWDQGQQMTLVQNENYTLTAKPILKTIVQKFIVDINQNVSQFQTNNLDAIAGDGTVVPPEQTPQIQAANGRVISVPASSWEHLEPYMGSAPFDSKDVRQATMQAINRKQIADVVFKGAAAVMNSPVPPSVYFSLDNPDFAKEFPEVAAANKLPIYNYDPAAAKALLDKAGWTVGGDGIRVKGGVKLSFEYGTTRNPTRQAIQALVANDLKQVGMDAVVTNYPTGFFGNEGPKATGKTKLAEFAYVQTSLSGFDPYSIDELWSTTNTARQNQQQYKNQKVTDAARQFNLELERVKTAQAAAVAQVEMMNDVAVIPLVQRANIEIVKNSLQNVKVTNTSVPQSWNMLQWYFK